MYQSSPFPAFEISLRIGMQVALCVDLIVNLSGTYSSKWSGKKSEMDNIHVTSNYYNMQSVKMFALNGKRTCEYGKCHKCSISVYTF
jgi:hypothetical protein